MFVGNGIRQAFFLHSWSANLLANPFFCRNLELKQRKLRNVGATAFVSLLDDRLVITPHLPITVVREVCHPFASTPDAQHHRCAQADRSLKNRALPFPIILSPFWPPSLPTILG
jgi:hypothetical protein